jgi:hypothetical protein
VLGLMTATIRHVADPRAYALVVREFVLTGSPDLNAGMDHGAFLSDTATEMPSIAKMLLAAGQIKVEAKRASFISAKTRSVQAIADGFNRERLRLGLPLVEVHVSAGGTASVSVKGKVLTDFPEFAVEWDTDKNGRGPEDIPAGHTATVSHWKCARGHRWEAKVGDRIIRLLRCRRCVTKRADETTSLVAVHPQLLAAWDDHSNLPLTPHTIRATYGTAVIWRCMAGLGHPTYKASIKKRFKDAVPCPLCRKMRPAHADALPSPDQRLVDLDSFDDLF